MTVAAPWLPTRYSAPLSPDFPSLFDRFRGAFRIAWQAAMGYCLGPDQEFVLALITELRPDGRLRHRQFLVSMARQNGKSELAAALGLLVLLWKAAPYVVGIATSSEQARLVYRRAMTVIQRNKALRVRFDALTETRGIRAKSGGTWELKASKSAALQGIPIDLGIADEVHLLLAALWNDLVNGMGGRPDCLVAGITTAGDDDSLLLKHLYELADKGAIGFAIWEAPEARVPADDATLGRYLTAANPGIAAGRVDLATVIEDCRTMPDADVIRYRLNRFTASSSVFIGAGAWAGCARDAGEALPPGRLVFTVDRTPEWTHATITATVKDSDGLLWTEVVASLAKPSLEKLVRLCEGLVQHSPAMFAVDGYSLRELGEALRRRGMPVTVLRQVDVLSASSLAYAKIIQCLVRHANDALLSAQLPRAARRNVGTGFRISRQDSASDIDAVMATVLGLYVAETLPEVPDQIF